MEKNFFKETIDYFSRFSKKKPQEEDLKNYQVELFFEDCEVVISKSDSGGLMMEICLGIMLAPFPEEKLRELAMSNFLGINTAGCTFFCDEIGQSLSLRCFTSPGTSKQENWQWLHRLVSVTKEWSHMLSLWKSFLSLTF